MIRNHAFVTSIMALMMAVSTLLAASAPVSANSTAQARMGSFQEQGMNCEIGYVYPAFYGNFTIYDSVTVEAWWVCISQGVYTSWRAAGEWDFGDGTGAVSFTGEQVQHQYTKDGTYLVKFVSYDTMQGMPRTAETTITIQTHDVSIHQIEVNKTMKTGQSRAIVVDLATHFYDERVQVNFFKRVGGGDWQWLGYITQDVLLSSKKDTQFVFTYSPTSEDAGQYVIFKAEANLYYFWDARSSDNQIVSSPVHVIK